MASRHPLDVFQSSSSGFEKASRRRRTISGKVITHRARETGDERTEPEEGAPAPEEAEAPTAEVESVEAAAEDLTAEQDRPVAEEPPTPPSKAGSKGQRKGKGKTKGQPKERQRAVPAEAAAAEQAPAPAPAEPRRPTRITGAAARPGRLTQAPVAAAEPAPVAEARPARRPLPSLGRPGPGLSKVLLGGTVAVVLALVVWIGVKSFGGADEGPELAVLNKNEALGQPASSGEPLAEAPVGVWTIQAATYSPSENGQRLAWDAHDELVARGYGEVLVSGQQGQDDAGRPRLTSCVLLVGRSADRDQLDELLARLVAVGDWPHGSRRPFTDARIVEHPHP